MKRERRADIPMIVFNKALGKWEVKGDYLVNETTFENFVKTLRFCIRLNDRIYTLNCLKKQSKYIILENKK